MSTPNLAPYLTTRQRAREQAFQFLYRYDQELSATLTHTELENEFAKHVAHFESNPESEPFALRLIKTTLDHLQAVDAMILKHLQNWRPERLGAIEKSFLRMGTAELIYFKDVPASVTLDEVVELSKRFGEAETPAFLNGILDPIAKEPDAVDKKVLSNS